VHMAALQKRKTSLLAATRQAMTKTLETAGIRLISGEAELSGPTQAVVRTADDSQTRIDFQHLILALGSSPSWPELLAPDGKAVLTSNHALDLSTIPESLAVIGAGAIGLEMAQFFQRMGSSVTLIEAAERIAPTEDPEICAQLASMLKRQGVTVRASATVCALERTAEGIRVRLGAEEEVATSKVLVAAGRKPNTHFPGLETILPARKKNALEVDENLKLCEHIFAVGDCNGRTIPFCIYGDPEAFRVGPTLEEARAKDVSCTESKAQLAANPVAQAAAAPHGLVKVLWRDDTVIGVSAVGHGVLHLVTAATIMVGQGWSRSQAENLIFAHPTLDETLRHALLAPPQ